MAQTAQLRKFEQTENEAQRVFALQRDAYLAHPYPCYEERRENLNKLDRVLVDNAQAIAEAINADFGHRAVEETLMAEVFANRRRHPRHAEARREVDEAAEARASSITLRGRLEPRDPAAEGRGRHRVAVELSALPDRWARSPAFSPPATARW